MLMRGHGRLVGCSHLFVKPDGTSYYVSTVLIAFLCGSVRDTASHSCHPRKISFSLWLTTTSSSPSLDLIALVIRDGGCAIFNQLVIVVCRTRVLTGRDSDCLFQSTLHRTRTGCNLTRLLIII